MGGDIPAGHRLRQLSDANSKLGLQVKNGRVSHQDLARRVRLVRLGDLLVALNFAPSPQSLELAIHSSVLPTL